MPDDYFGEKNDKWDWKNFKNTQGFPISDQLIDWIIGQDQAIRECRLCIDEWVHKLTYLKKKKWWKAFEDPMGLKPQPKEWLPAGPFLLLLGDAGTGKSLIGRAMSSYMTEVYKKHKIKLYDVLSWKNKDLPSEPKISIHQAGKGKEIIFSQTHKIERKSWFQRWGIKLLRLFMGGFGLVLIGLSMFIILASENPLWTLITVSPLVIGGGSLLFFAVMIGWFGKLSGGGPAQGIGGAERSDAPKLLVDNSSGRVPFVDATGHGSAQLFGSIAWDPYQQLSEDTEVLTKQGWKFIGEITKDDEVATLRDGKYFEWNKPCGEYVKEAYDGKMVHIYGGSLDILVHPEHRLLIKDDGKYVFKKARDCVGIPITVKKDAVWISDKSIDKNMVELWGWFITEGSSYPDGHHKTIKITQVKTKTRKEIMDLLRRMHISFNTTFKDIKISHNVRLYNEFHKLSHQEHRYIPQQLKELNSFYLKILLETLIKGDGTLYKDGRWRYYTCSKRLADDVQEIALKLGIATTVKQTSPSKTKTGRKQWYITNVNSESTVIPKYVNYYGMIRCLAVKNETLYIRRNGRTAWCGNTGGLGTPEHQRVSAGDVHRAHLGILFIDEIKNLTGAEAITLLTVLEEGQIPIALRSLFHGGDTAAMAVSTEPVPAMVFFIAAGNLDSLPNIHPALLDRIQGYGKTVYMNNYMDNTVENRRKVVQFIAQEIKRFNLLPFTRESCIEIIEESRRKSGRKDKLTTKFRPLISIIKTASTLARDKDESEVDVKYVREAVEVHCKSIYQQILERIVTEKNVYLIINPKSEPKIGQIYGLAVTKDPNADEMMGTVLPIRASMEEPKKKQNGYFHITGVDVKNESYIQHSISKVSHVIQQICGFSPLDKRTHIDFAQSHGVEGPSAGVAMTLALLSIINKKEIRQDVAVTGEINVGVDGQIMITPIGGTHEKIMAAQRWGFSKVLIPLKNYENDIIPSEYKIKVVGCQTIEDYAREIFD
jgi:lon-related putative ATP-dependent protease